MKLALLTIGLLLMSCAGFAQPIGLTITTPAALPSGTVGTAYSQTLIAAFGNPPYAWLVTSGALPAGLALSAAGVIAGTPTAYGSATFGVTVTDSVPTSVSQTFTLTIKPGPLAIGTTSPLPAGLTGTAYSRALTATGGVTPYSWSVTAGSLPAGLVLSASGQIAGIPTAVVTSTFTAAVTDANLSSASQVFSMTISLTSLVISTTSLPSGLAGTAYSQAIAASGGLPPYTWFVGSGSLPAGLTLSSAGVIAGTPTTAGIYSFSIDAGYSIFFVSQSFTLTIGGAPLSVSTPSTLPYGSTGTAYSQTLAAAGGVPPYAWSIFSGTLPPGLTLSASGAITGTPTVSGNYVFSVQVQDSTSLTYTAPFSLTVTAAGVLPRLGVFSQVTGGGGWTTIIWLINRTSASVQTTLAFHGDNGSPLVVPLNVAQPGVTQETDVATLNEVIAPNTTLVVTTETLTANYAGWCDVLSNGVLSGFAVFSNGSAEAAVPLQSQIGNSISLPFDNTNGASTGVALANLASAQANITATVWDQNGNQIAVLPVTLTQTDASGNGHDSFMLPSRLAATAGIRGIVQFQGNPGTAQIPAGQLTGLGLRAEANGLFTSTPTIVP